MASAEVSKPEVESDEDVEASSFTVVEKLQEIGINAGDIAKLKAAGIHTVESILMHTRKDIAAVKGMSEAKVEKLFEAAGKLRSLSFVTGTEFLKKRQDVIRLSTGSTQLDQLLGGGVESMSITELFGEFRTGKTQLCHTLCVTSQLPRNMGGGNGKVVYIDTEGTFRPERIGPIAERFGASGDQILDNVLYARALTHEHQMDLLTEVAARMVDDVYRLLVMDSVTSLFRVEFSGRGELAERQQKLGRMLSRLMKIAEEFNVAVVITNQVCADPSGGAVFVQDPKKPIGGHVLAHASTTRLFLRKGKGEQRVAKVYDSPSLPEAEATFQIGTTGITDAKD
eukprot:m51a1_g6762 Meiotic recombination protein DMC1 putative (340) ;mRNA; r:95797-97108